MSAFSPVISVIMSVYNGEKYLQQAIDSILAQTFSDFEFIIINDGSTDRTAEIIQSYFDERIRYIEHENMGLSASLQKGVSMCQGKYVARMDADDYALPTRFEQQVHALEANPDCALLGSPCYVIAPDETFKFIMAHPCGNIDIKWFLLFDSPFVHSTIIMRKEMLLDVGSYYIVPEISYVEDYDLWSRFARKHKVMNLSEPLIYYRDNPDGISHSKRQTQAQQSLAVSAKNIGWLLGEEISLAEAKQMRYLRTNHQKIDQIVSTELQRLPNKIIGLYQAFITTYANEMDAVLHEAREVHAEMVTMLANLTLLCMKNNHQVLALSTFRRLFFQHPRSVFNSLLWTECLSLLKHFGKQIVIRVRTALYLTGKIK